MPAYILLHIYMFIFQLEGDVNMPAMYDFVRDRMRLIPTNMYLAKQHLKLNFQSGIHTATN